MLNVVQIIRSADRKTTTARPFTRAGYMARAKDSSLPEKCQALHSVMKENVLRWSGGLRDKHMLFIFRPWLKPRNIFLG